MTDNSLYLLLGIVIGFVTGWIANDFFTSNNEEDLEEKE